MSILSAISYLLNKKKIKKTALNRLKLKAIFFIYTHDLQEQNFLVFFFYVNQHLHNKHKNNSHLAP